jgi:glycerol-3-phosphate acyltransferase PlsY
VYRAGGHALFFLALVLDVAKGAVPVSLAYHVLGIRDWAVVPIALAPVLGHAFSPFLRFRGGKALAVTLGVWIGLTIWPVPVAALLGIVLWRLVLEPTGWAVVLALAGMLATLLVWQPDPVFLSVIAGNAMILIWTHREDLAQAPRPRPAVLRLLGRRGE